MALLVCLLLPHAWDAGMSAARRCLYGAGAGAGIGMLAVVLSQSRGAYVVLYLPMFLAVLHGLRSHRL